MLLKRSRDWDVTWYDVVYEFDHVRCAERGMGWEYNSFKLGLNTSDVKKIVKLFKERGHNMNYLDADELCNHPREKITFQAGHITFVAFVDDYGGVASDVDILVNGLPWLSTTIQVYKDRIQSLEAELAEEKARLAAPQEA